MTKDGEKYWETLRELIVALRVNGDVLKKDAVLREKFDKKAEWLYDHQVGLAGSDVLEIEAKMRELLKDINKQVKI